MRPRTFHRLLAAGLFLLTALVFLVGNFRHAGNDDMVPTVLTSARLARGGGFWLDDFTPWLRERRSRGELPNLAEVAGRYVTPYPPAPTVLALPVFLADRFLFPGGELTPARALRLGRTAAALMALVAVGALYVAMGRWFGRRTALAAALIYAFGTPLWYLSQAMWQHVPFQMMVCLAMALVATAPGSGRLPLTPSRLFLTAAALGIAGACRYQNAVLLLPPALWLFARATRRGKVSFLGGGLIPLAFVLWFHHHHFGSPFRQGLTLGHFNFRYPMWLGAASILFSPSFGLIVTAPVLFLLGPLAWSGIAPKGATLRRRLVLPMGLGALGLFLLLSVYNGWFGGYSYSSRMIADAIPCLLVALGPGIRRLVRGGFMVRVAGAVLVAFAALVNAIGVYAWDQSWNVRFDKGLGDQRWVWTVRDAMPWYYLRRGAFLVPARIADGLDARAVRLWLPAEEREGWNGLENWGGKEVRWTRLQSSEVRPAGRHQVRYLVGHRDLKVRPVEVSVTDGEGRLIHRASHQAEGEYSFEVESVRPITLTWIVSRPFEAEQDPRVLGVAVFEPGEIAE